MPRYANRVQETVSGTPGTGTITLGGAVVKFRTFAAGFPDRPAFVGYVIEDGNAWEVGEGTLSSTGTTLTREKLRSSSTGSFLNLTSAALVFSSPSADFIQKSSTGYCYAQSRGFHLP